MILGQTPTQQNPIDFQPPAVGGGNVFSLPGTGFRSANFWPFSQVMPRMSAYPAYMPTTHGGPVPMPSIMPPAPAAAPMAPAPGTTPSGTAGAFGGSGFGSSGGVRSHGHIDPYRVMRSGMIPGVSPNGSNIRSGVTNAGANVMASMPYQSAPLAMAPAAMPAMPAPMPAGTNGFGAFSFNPVNWFRRPVARPVSRPNPSMMVQSQSPHGIPSSAYASSPSPGGKSMAAQQHKALERQGCETVGPRLDGTTVTMCNGRVVAISDGNGNFRRVG